MALRSTPSNNITSNGGTITGNTNFPNGINVYSENIAINDNSIKYYKLARVRFISTTGNPNGTYERALFNIKLYHTGDNLKIANVKGYFYNGATKRSIHVTSFLMVINNSGSTGFSAGDILYFPLDSGSDSNDFIVDIYMKVTNNAKLYENTESAAFENGALLTIKPDGSILISSLPVAGTTTTIDSITYTYGASVNGVITSDLNSQTATTQNAIPKFADTAGQLVGSQKLSINASDQLVSTVASGAGSPFLVGSTTRVDNLNADRVDDIHGTDLLKKDGTVAMTGTLVIPSYSIGSHSVKNFGSLPWSNGVANEKIDIDIPNGTFHGSIIVKIWGSYSNVSATGYLEKRIDFYANTSSSIGNIQSNYTYVGKDIKNFISITDIKWDAIKTKYVITICKLTSTSSPSVLEVESFIALGSSSVINYTLSSVYTTDTTVYPKATLQSEGLNIVTEVTGTAPPTVAPSFAGQMYVDTTNKKVYEATGITNSSDWLPLVSNLDSIIQTARVATTANITLSGLQTIDGYTTVAGDRVLVKDQSTGSQNGLYVAASGSWSRTTDIIISHTIFNVERGTLNRDTIFMVTTDAPITIGTTALTIVPFGKPISVISLSGTAAPAVTPAFVGQQFVDTTNKKIYVSTGTTNSSDWTILN